MHKKVCVTCNRFICMTSRSYRNLWQKIELKYSDNYGCIDISNSVLVYIRVNIETGYIIHSKHVILNV